MIFSTVLPGLWGLTLPIPFPIGYVTCYLVEGDPLTLIDCGTQTDECYAALSAALAEKGYQIKDVKRLIITHHHSDHLGLAGRIVQESGAKVWASRETVPWLEAPEGARQKLQSFTELLFRQGGVPADRLTTLELVSQFMASLSGTAKVDQTLSEGDTLDMLGCSWRVYHTPGHAGDLICFYQPETRVMLSSDHLLKDVSSNALIEAPARPGDPRPRRLLDYLEQMQRMAKLDIAIAYPGHGKPFDDIPTLVESRLAFSARRADKLFNFFSAQPHTLFELTRLMFPQVPDTELFLALSETLGHLDLLERDGRVIQRMGDGLSFWHPA